MTNKLKPVGDGGDLDPFPPASERPKFVVIDDKAMNDGREVSPGVYYCIASPGKKGQPPQLRETRISSPLYVDAQTCDEHGNNFGRLYRYKSSKGQWGQCAVPQEIQAAGDAELRRYLLARGVDLPPKHRAQFWDYVNHRTPGRHLRCATSTGWAAEKGFVLPSEVIGPAAGEIVFQNPAPFASDGHEAKGTLDEWKAHVALFAVGNPLLLVGISTAFAAPLLRLVHAEGGGLHLFGASSTGKTSGLHTARSVWGGPAFCRSWRATANGLEGIASLHNDLLLPLDEIGQITGRALDESAYMIANGTGKSRADRYGTAREAKRWLTLLLSTGEVTVSSQMEKGGLKAHVGQNVRILDMPVRRTHGLFDDLHHFHSGQKFADELRHAADTYYGTAGRAFLDKLTRDDRDLSSLLALARKQPDFNAEQGQETRVAARFALIGFAGELATEYGTTGWPEGAAMDAAIASFEIWRDHHGNGQQEPKKILRAVSDFIDRNGASRFDLVGSSVDLLIRDRAGWREGGEKGAQYYFNGDGLREAVRPYDFKTALDVLVDAGVLARGADGKASHTRRLGGKKTRVYLVNVEQLSEACEEE